MNKCIPVSLLKTDLDDKSKQSNDQNKLTEINIKNCMILTG